MSATEWTLEELSGKVAELLDSAAYAAPNGRVQEVPDARTIRWYSTIGLVDRPVMRGRTAVYGPRHLLQLVAVKRRQAQGRKIAQIQAELADAPDDVLLGIAELPEGLDLPVERPAPQAPARRFWAEPPGEFAGPTPPAPPNLLTGVPLGGGAVLLLNAAPSGEDLALIRSAARGLMELLAARGLTTDDGQTHRRGSAG